METHRLSQEEAAPGSRRLTFACLAAAALAMLALPALFVLPDRIGAAGEPPPPANCSRMGPDFQPVRLRLPDGRTRVVCALFGVLGRE